MAFALHAATGTGVKAPAVYELYGYVPPPGGFINNPDLKPEKSEGWEAGVEVTFLGGDGDRRRHLLQQHAQGRDRHRVPAAEFFDAHPYNVTGELSARWRRGLTLAPA